MKRPQVFANLLTFTTHLEATHRPLLDELKKGGVDGVEPSFFDGDETHWRQMGVMCRDAGLEVRSAVTMVDPDHDPSSLDDNVRRAGLDHLKQRINLACALADGAGLTSGPIVLCGPLVFPWSNRQSSPGGVELVGADLVAHFAQRRARAIESHRAAAEYAQPRGVLILPEYLTHWEIPAFATLVEAVDFTLEVDHPCHGTHVDTSHEALDGGGPDVFRTQIGRLKRAKKPVWFHVSAPARASIRYSWIPWEQTMRPIAEFENVIPTVEIFDGVEPFAGGVRLNRGPFADPMAEVLDGVEYTREQWLKYGVAS